MTTVQDGGEAEKVSAAELLRLGAATLGESGAAVMAARIKPAWPGARLAGPGFPVSCRPGDNLALHVAVTRAGRGSVLIADVGEMPEFGYWGEVLTTAAEAAGLTGLVIDGGVRDIDAIAEHGFSVFSALVALKGASKVGRGTAGLPTTVGGVDVQLGDWVVGDADGVAVVPARVLYDVVSAARARAEKEQGLFSDLRAGRTTVELLGLEAGAVAVK